MKTMRRKDALAMMGDAETIREEFKAFCENLEADLTDIACQSIAENLKDMVLSHSRQYKSRLDKWLWEEVGVLTVFEAAHLINPDNPDQGLRKTMDMNELEIWDWINRSSLRTILKELNKPYLVELDLDKNPIIGK